MENIIATFEVAHRWLYRPRGSFYRTDTAKPRTPQAVPADEKDGKRMGKKGRVKEKERIIGETARNSARGTWREERYFGSLRDDWGCEGSGEIPKTIKKEGKRCALSDKTWWRRRCSANSPRSARGAHQSKTWETPRHWSFVPSSVLSRIRGSKKNRMMERRKFHFETPLVCVFLCARPACPIETRGAPEIASAAAAVASTEYCTASAFLDVFTLYKHLKPASGAREIENP